MSHFDWLSANGTLHMLLPEYYYRFFSMQGRLPQLYDFVITGFERDLMAKIRRIRLVVSAVLLAIVAAAAQDQSLLLTGSIKSMVGNVEVSSTAGKWRPARVGMMVKMGWDVRTYIESGADIEFETGTVLRVGENSVVTLSKMILDKRADVTSSTIKVATGKVWANVKKLTNTKSSFEFETPTAVASIRGTRLGIAVDRSGTQIDVYEGLVMVRPRGGAGKEVAVSTRNRAVIGEGTHAIRLVTFTPEKDTIKGQAPMVDPFRDTTGTKKIDALLDTTRLAAAKDTTLRLDIVSPASGASVKETPVLLKGKTGSGAAIDIGGREAAVERDGSFSMLVDLILGKNTIAVTAHRGGAAKTAEITVEYHPVLMLNVANIVDNMEVTSSEIQVDVEVTEGAKFSVNGREGQTKAGLVPGRNVITVRAWDQWNTSVEKTVAVNYAKSGGFSLNLVSPKDQSSVREPAIPVSGSTAPGAKVTVNGVQASVGPAGFFTYSAPIPDEPNKEFTVRVVARLGDEEASEERTVVYNPPRAPLTLTITTPVDGQIIRQNTLRLIGKTSPRARVTINGRMASVSSAGIITYDMQFAERDIGDFFVEVVASDDSSEVTKSINVKIDPSSPQINTTVPVLSIPLLEGTMVARSPRMLVSVTDKTPDDQITLVIQNNGSREEMNFTPGDQQYFNLEEGKNTYTISAYDLAKNASRVFHGYIYYLPGRFTIDIVEPSSTVMSVDDLPPGPPPTAANKWVSKMLVEIEVDDGIRNIPETIRDVRVKDDKGNAFLMLNRQNYRYSVEVPVNRGYTRYTVVATDIAGNEGGTQTFTVNIK
jgi:hypothetical protein